MSSSNFIKSPSKKKQPPGRYWVQLCPTGKGFMENFTMKMSLLLLRFMDPSPVQSVKLWEVDSDFLKALVLPGWD